MQPDQIRALLEQVKNGKTPLDDAFNRLAALPFSDLGDVKVDNHRALRCGFAEVIFCAGKEPRDVVRIIEEGLLSAPCMLATRADKRHFDAIREKFPSAIINLRGKTARVGQPMSMKTRGSVMVVTAGTSDIPVAEEALETLRAFGCEGLHCYDVGVAGLHRVLAALPKLREAAAIICVAGMEGALPSVVGGLVACPVIAVPTSIGYGASFNGVAALLGMLNTCAAGVTVVNIDNGFGAAMSALRMIADRAYPIVVAPRQELETISAEEIEAAKSAARDQQLVRLEKAAEQLSALAHKPVMIESPKIEINHPNQNEQVARLEKAIGDLAAMMSKQSDHADKSSAAKASSQSDLISRMENAVVGLASLAQKPIVVESPKIEFTQPGQGEQIARLEKAIGELAAISLQQKEISGRQPGDSGALQNDLVKRLDQTIEQLAAVALRPLVVEVKQPLLARVETPVLENISTPVIEPHAVTASAVHAAVEIPNQKTVVVKDEPKVKKSTTAGRKSARK